MFKIYDDKVYFVAETPDINKVIEIFLPKDDRGTIMDSHEIRVDLCRAIRKLQHDGYTIMKVYPAMGDRRESIDVLSMPEFIQSAKCPDNDVEEAVVFSYFESGATFQLPCKVNKETHEIFDVTCAAMPCDDDCFSYAEVKINGKDYPVNFIDDILLENNVDVDVMRNGNDYYIIDMALAENSALNDCVPKNLLRAYPQQWLPGESNS